ncbi:uncharacterized protein TNCV_1897511 [Trichonephila clavipes]|nr:uncharacterized protein TNCV_1897511 [Trichonephila clavipes]
MRGEASSPKAVHHAATPGLLATDYVILNHGQVTWTTPELAPPLLTTTPHQREDVSALNRFSVHRCPTRRVFTGTGFELMTKPATIRYPYKSATAARNLWREKQDSNQQFVENIAENEFATMNWWKKRQWSLLGERMVCQD